MNTSIKNTIRSLRSAINVIKQYDIRLAGLERNITQLNRQQKDLIDKADIDNCLEKERIQSIKYKITRISQEIRQTQKEKRHYVLDLKDKACTHQNYLNMVYPNENFDEIFSEIDKYIESPITKMRCRVCEELEHLDNYYDDVELDINPKIALWLEAQINGKKENEEVES